MKFLSLSFPEAEIELDFNSQINTIYNPQIFYILLNLAKAATNYYLDSDSFSPLLFNHVLNFDFSFSDGRNKTFFGSKSNLESVKEYVHYFFEQKDALTSIPLLVFYNLEPTIKPKVDLCIADTEFRIPSAFKGAFDRVSDFSSFFSWFRNRQDVEFEHIVRKEQIGLQTIMLNTLIAKILPGFVSITCKRNPSVRIEVISPKSYDLKDIALVGDITRRLYICNPDCVDVTKQRGAIFLKNRPKYLKEISNTFTSLQFFILEDIAWTT